MTSIHPAVALPDTESRLIKSSEVDHEFKLFVSLPAGYRGSDERFPVLYVLDANLLFSVFPILFAMWSPLPPMIVVGVGYPTDNFAEIYRLRSRHFLATSDPGREQASREGGELAIESGMGERFLAFFRNELISFIDAEYRTVPGARTLFGYSWGGNFGLYTLFSQPETFQRYIVGAPDLRWDNGACFGYEADYAGRASDLETRLYLGVGSADEDLVEHNFSNLVKFDAVLRSREYPGLALDFEITPDETHVTAIVPFAAKAVKAMCGA